MHCSALAKELHQQAPKNNISFEQRLSLAKLFVNKLKPNMNRAYTYNNIANINEKNILLDGETLLLEAILNEKFHLNGLIMGYINKGEILISLNDFIETLNLPISITPQKKTANGWYIRENKKFELDLNNKIAKSDIGKFKTSNKISVKDDNIWVPIYEIEKWFDLDIVVKIASQELKIKSKIPFPIEERHNRRISEFKKIPKSKPTRPLGGEKYKLITPPSVDIATSSTYRKNSISNKPTINHNVNIRTTNDFMYGTLTTQSRINNDNQLSHMIINYKQESNEPKLLGPLKARRFDIGDIVTTHVAVGGQVSQETGIRITNTNSLRNFLTPTTSISGTAFPGWDVELYRNTQLIKFQEVDENGFYSFDNIDLYLSDNNFRLIFYGPQGEVREETVFVPVNQKSLTYENSAYDISLSLSEKNTYRKNLGYSNKDKNPGSLNISAYYEKPITDATTISAGLWSSKKNDKRNSAINLGFSTIKNQSLINATMAIDDDGDIYSEVSLRKDIGQHELRNLTTWEGENFDNQSSGETEKPGSFRNNFSIVGPLPWNKNNKQRYILNTNYIKNTDGDSFINALAGLSLSIKNTSVNQQISYDKSTNSQNSDSLRSLTHIARNIGKNRIRISSDYSLKPERELNSINATYRKNFTKKTKIELSINKKPQRRLTEYQAKLDWQAGFARISPSIKYDSNKNLFAGLNTKIGILKDPSQKKIKLIDSNITNTGSVSVFVYLDKDGNGKFNDDDEALENIAIVAPQNGGRIITNKDGIALFNRMQRLKLTDIYLDKETLQDPTWVSSFEGVSILPREGYTAKVEFPIHISGEIDGSVYARSVNISSYLKYNQYNSVINGGNSSIDNDIGNDSDSIKQIKLEPVPLRSVVLNLYNDKGKLENSATTDATGFYYFPQVPPGRYLLIISEKSAQKGRFIRPEPQQIEIKYDGTVIYGNDIYVDMGDGDIPSEFLPDLNDYKSRHPHIDFTNKNNSLVINLGEFNSRLLMSVTWYKIKSRYRSIISGTQIFVPPTQSYADIKTGKHILRVGLEKGKTIKDAYSICKSLIAREQYCKVEIYPAYIKQAKASTTASNSEQ